MAAQLHTEGGPCLVALSLSTPPLAGHLHVSGTSALLPLQWNAEVRLSQPMTAHLIPAHSCKAQILAHLISGVQGALGLSGGQWSADWQITKSSKCLYLHRRLAQIGAAPPLAPQPCPEQVRCLLASLCFTTVPSQPGASPHSRAAIGNVQYFVIINRRR